MHDNKKTVITMIHNNNQDLDTSSNSLFIQSMTINLYMTFDHHKIQYIKYSVDTNLTILSYLFYVLLSNIYYKNSI